MGGSVPGERPSPPDPRPEKLAVVFFLSHVLEVRTAFGEHTGTFFLNAILLLTGYNGNVNRGWRLTGERPEQPERLRGANCWGWWLPRGALGTALRQGPGAKHRGPAVTAA